MFTNTIPKIIFRQDRDEVFLMAVHKEGVPFNFSLEESNYQRYGFCGFVAKPYKFGELIEVLNTVLNPK